MDRSERRRKLRRRNGLGDTEPIGAPNGPRQVAESVANVWGRLGLTSDQQQRVVDLVRANEQLPTRVAIMGQTGVGKSSLVNGLFGSKLRTGAVRPTTLEPQEVPAKLGRGRRLVFVDLPGIGESRGADETYLNLYIEELERADVAIWAFSADSRSLLFDMDSLDRLLSHPGLQSGVLDRMTFTLTKADLAISPWILGNDSGKGSFVPHPSQSEILCAKCLFVSDTLTTRFGPGDYAVIATSTRFRYKLDQVLLEVLRRTEPATVARLAKVLNIESLTTLPLADAASLRNFVYLDNDSEQLLDVAQLITNARKTGDK
jgi:predicted GTPase